MRVVRFAELELGEGWAEDRDDVAARDAFATHWQAGARDSAVAYFELDPGKHIGRHIHSCEETIVVLEGSVEITVGDEIERIDGAGLAVAPALVRHDAACVGDGVAKCLGFFSSATVVSVYDDVLMPGRTRLSGTPSYEEAGASR